MEFKDSGLPQNKLVEDAFNFSKANTLGKEKEVLKDIQQQIDMIFAQQRMMLDMERQAGGMTENEYEQEKKQMEQQRKQQLNAVKPAILQQLNNLFEASRVAPAKELQANAEKASPELLAAVMLIDCVRSPLDYQNIATKFGETVAGLIAEVVHIEAYPSEREDNLGKAAPDAKRAYLATLITSLDSMTKQIQKVSKAGPGQKIILPPGQEEQLYNDALPVWGNDKKLDARFVESFNKSGEAAGSLYRLEVGTKGELELVKDIAPPPPKTPKLLPGPKGPKPPGGNGGIGGDVF